VEQGARPGAQPPVPEGVAPPSDADHPTQRHACDQVLGRKGKSLFMPMRVALTGRGSGPDLPAQLQVLALAPGAVASGTSVMGLDERMAELEQVIVAAAAAEPAKAAA
jgi:glutamyl-tRNA synthetase